MHIHFLNFTTTCKNDFQDIEYPLEGKQHPHKLGSFPFRVSKKKKVSKNLKITKNGGSLLSRYWFIIGSNQLFCKLSARTGQSDKYVKIWAHLSKTMAQNPQVNSITFCLLREIFMHTPVYIDIYRYIYIYNSLEKYSPISYFPCIHLLKKES